MQGRSPRLRLLISVALGLGTVGLTVASAVQGLHLPIAVPLAPLLAIIPVLWPEIEGWLRRMQSGLDEQDRAEEDRVKQLADRARLDLMEQIRNDWVQPERQEAFPSEARIELRLAERQEAVDHPTRAALLKRPDGRDQLVAPAKPIGHIYRDLGRQLLILGEPGAGKTTLLLELTGQLLEWAEAVPEPVPVVLNLSSWAVHQQIFAAWLVDELNKNYGVPRRLGQLWVNTERIIPMLDGLDEMAAEHRDSCVVAINSFHDDHGQLPMVVCCRTKEYDMLATRLRLRGAIVIQALSTHEVHQYLRDAGRPLAAVRAVMRDDTQLADLLTTPLFLDIVTLTYEGKSAAAVRASGTVDVRRQRVLGDYVEAMLDRPQSTLVPAPYARTDTIRWLSWLAAAMRTHGQSIFHLDWMQPDWLPARPRRLVTLGVAVATGAASAILVAIAYVPTGFLIDMVIFGHSAAEAGRLLIRPIELAFTLLPGLVTGLVVGAMSYETTITPTEQLRWSWSALKRNFERAFRRGMLAGGLAAGLVGAVAGGAYGAGLLGGPPLARLGLAVLGACVGALFFGVAGGWVIGVPFGLFSGLEPTAYVIPPAPGRAIQRCKRNGLVGGVLAGLVVAVVIGPAFGLTGLGDGLRAAVSNGLIAGFFFGIFFGLLVGLQRGGGAYLRHLALLRVVAQVGLGPRNYRDFLEYASQLILLRRRGGAYEFMHPLLLEHLASLSARRTASTHDIAEIS